MGRRISEISLTSSRGSVDFSSSPKSKKALEGLEAIDEDKADDEESYLFQINYLPGTSNFRMADFMKIFEKMSSQADNIEHDSFKKKVFNLLVGKRGRSCHIYHLCM